MNPSEKRPKHQITAGELAEKLEKDSNYLERSSEFERKRHQASIEFAQFAAPVFKELSHVGIVIDSFSDLYKDKAFANKKTYGEAVPILLKWLPKLDDLRVKESIIRSLSVKWAKPVAAPGLLDEFRRVNDPDGLYKWAIGNALSVIADDSVFEDIVELAQDRKQGKAREMIAVALGNMKDIRAVDVLIGLLQDEQVAGHAIMALGKLKSAKARPSIEPFLTHEKAWIRKEARRALAKIDRTK